MGSSARGIGHPTLGLFQCDLLPTRGDSLTSVALTMEKTTFQGAYKALELSIEKVRIMN